MSEFGRLYSTVEQLEPYLEVAMRFHHAAYPEGFLLRTSICGFASRVLGECLKQDGLQTEWRVGRPVDDPSLLPDRMRTHALLAHREATVDPTWTQWMTLVGVDARQASRNPAMAALYPPRRVAVIPAGLERLFGERFADYALDTVGKVARIRRKMGGVATQESWSTDDVCVWMSHEEAFELLADIWNPERYQPLDHENDAEVLVQKAVDHIHNLKIVQ